MKTSLHSFVAMMRRIALGGLDMDLKKKICCHDIASTGRHHFHHVRTGFIGIGHILPGEAWVLATTSPDAALLNK